MIVRQDKSYETNSMFPNTNWYKDEDNYVVDETTKEGVALAQRIIKAYPYYDFVVEDGKLVDIIPIERPPEPEPTPEPTLSELQEQQLAQAEAIAAIFEMLTGGEA